MTIKRIVILAVLLGLPSGILLAQDNADYWRTQRERAEREWDQVAEEQDEGLEDAAHLADMTDADIAEIEHNVTGAREDLAPQVAVEDGLSKIWNGLVSWGPTTLLTAGVGYGAYKGGPALGRFVRGKILAGVGGPRPSGERRDPRASQRHPVASGDDI